MTPAHKKLLYDLLSRMTYSEGSNSIRASVTVMDYEVQELVQLYQALSKELFNT